MREIEFKADIRPGMCSDRSRLMLPACDLTLTQVQHSLLMAHLSLMLKARSLAVDMYALDGASYAQKLVTYCSAALSDHI